ncbi:hypothetical protein PR048_001227 [Dryococelus australis]|uniref:Uncharacterized protein n=1 Tax=Dryococelus australis TaxID=614101 RepID=A0ABQ9IGU9_9NEOP|nr:hypothetical protein PR048_001227 [Dryococelus australis]
MLLVSADNYQVECGLGKCKYRVTARSECLFVGHICRQTAALTLETVRLSHSLRVPATGRRDTRPVCAQCTYTCAEDEYAVYLIFSLWCAHYCVASEPGRARAASRKQHTTNTAKIRESPGRRLVLCYTVVVIMREKVPRTKVHLAAFHRLFARRCYSLARDDITAILSRRNLQTDRVGVDPRGNSASKVKKRGSDKGDTNTHFCALSLLRARRAVFPTIVDTNLMFEEVEPLLTKQLHHKAWKTNEDGERLPAVTNLNRGSNPQLSECEQTKLEAPGSQLVALTASWMSHAEAEGINLRSPSRSAPPGAKTSIALADTTRRGVSQPPRAPRSGTSGGRASRSRKCEVTVNRLYILQERRTLQARRVFSCKPEKPHYIVDPVRLARRNDEAQGVRVSVVRIASSLLDLGREGQLVNMEGDVRPEIFRRIKLGWQAVGKHYIFLKSNMSINLKKQFTTSAFFQC